MAAAEDQRLSSDHFEIEELARFYGKFLMVASLQGRFSYLIMSVHAVNPYLLSRVISGDPEPYLFANMLYGVAAMIFRRPSMRIISIVNRLSFSILGSMMFNYSSMLVFNYIADKCTGRPYTVTFLGFLSGRIMLLHLLAYLYHVDSRNRLIRVRPNSDYESMYQ